MSLQRSLCEELSALDFLLVISLSIGTKEIQKNILPIGRKYIDNLMLGLKIGSYRSNSRLCILFNPGVIEFVCGGFPCQGTSVPGQHV